MHLTRLLSSLTYAIGLLVAAPAAQADCDTAAVGSDCAKWAEVLATAAEVTRRLEDMSSGPFMARTSYYGGGWDSEQYGSIFFRAGVTRHSMRAFAEAGEPGRVTYLDSERSCARTITKAYPNTLTADVKASWKCRARKASDSDLDAVTFLRSWVPVVPKVPEGAEYASATRRADPGGDILSLSVATRGITFSYVVDPSGMELSQVIRSYEMDATTAKISTSSIPILPSMSKFKVR